MPGVRFPVAEWKHTHLTDDTLTERLRWHPAKVLGIARAGSNPAGVVNNIETSVPVAQLDKAWDYES